MLTVYPEGEKAVWFDLHDPTPEEVEQAWQACKLHIPSRAELAEIEASSRLQADGDVITLSLPVTPLEHDQLHERHSSPVGFILTRERLVTIRFAELKTFHTVAEHLAAEHAECDSPEVFARLIEAIVDYGADRLEHIKAETRRLSRSVFNRGARPRRHVGKQSEALRGMLVELGDLDEQLSELRETLLTLQRALPFVADRGRRWIDREVLARLKTAETDIQSLNDFEVHLTDKVQFLLDATLGFINTQQNDIFKVLTIASIVGIPPTFFAGVYGMNFQNQPEYHWAFGYQWGWFVIILSTVLPIAWFKWRGWW